MCPPLDGNVVNLPEPLETIPIGCVRLRSAELIKTTGECVSRHKPLRPHTHTQPSPPSVTANSPERRRMRLSSGCRAGLLPLWKSVIAASRKMRSGCVSSSPDMFGNLLQALLGPCWWWRVCCCLYVVCDGTCAYTHQHTHTQVIVKVLAVICGSGNLEPRGRTRWFAVRRRGQMVVSHKVMDGTRLAVFSLTANKRRVRVADVAAAHPFPSQHT